MKSEKIQGMLGTALDEFAEADPSFPLDLVVTPVEQVDVEALLMLIDSCGGKTKRVGQSSVSAQVPAGHVECLAVSDLVSSLRLARLHRMH